MELGVIVGIYADTDPVAVFAEASQAGLQRGQVSFHIHGLTAERVRQTALAARDAGFHVDAVGCYVNPLRLEDPELSNVDITDWKTLAQNMSLMNGVERIVCWGGTLGRTLGTPNLLNQEEQTLNNLYIALSGMREQVRGLPVQILLEPYTAHVLHDARTCLRLAQRFPGGEVKIVLDAPNLLAPTDFGHRNERAVALATEMAPVIGMVHLKDIALGTDGHRIFAPVGSGSLDFNPYLRAIIAHIPEVPIVLESVKTAEEMREARKHIEDVLSDNGL